MNYWRFVSPWGALNGWGIPHHNLDAPRLGGGSAPGGSINYGSGGNAPFPTIDRSVAFPGASSNISAQVPSFNVPAPTAAYRTEKRFDPPYYLNYNSYWYHGYWGGGKWGWGRWGGPLGIGSFARWSFGPIYYVSGYGQFRNPFLNDARRAVPEHLDYSQVIEDLPEDDEPPARSSSTDPAETPPTDPADETAADRLKYLVRTPEVKAGLNAFDAASEAFQAKDYQSALQKIDEALAQLPDDTAIHEFRALILFARGEYQPAAETIYAVLAVSPGWDWTTLSSRYTDQEEYPRQLRALEMFHRDHPDSAAAAFLRAYHYTTCRHYEAAVNQFQTAVKLLPDDDLVPALAGLVAGAVEKAPSGSSPEVAGNPPRAASTATPQDQDNQPVAQARLVGAWKAFRGGTTGIQLTLRDDQGFVWMATREGKPRRIAGRYALEGNLVFLGGGSGTLIGRVQMKKQGGFDFTLLDGGSVRPGLDFAGDTQRK